MCRRVFIAGFDNWLVSWLVLSVGYYIYSAIIRVTHLNGLFVLVIIMFVGTCYTMSYTYVRRRICIL